MPVAALNGRVNKPRRRRRIDKCHPASLAAGSPEAVGPNVFRAQLRLPMQRSPPVHRRGSGACPDARRSNKPCATTISTYSVSPDSMSLPQLNPVEPPWYGPVCPVVGEGWHREVSPYPNHIILGECRSNLLLP